MLAVCVALSQLPDTLDPNLFRNPRVVRCHQRGHAYCRPKFSPDLQSNHDDTLMLTSMAWNSLYVIDVGLGLICWGMGGEKEPCMTCLSKSRRDNLGCFMQLVFWSTIRDTTVVVVAAN